MSLKTATISLLSLILSLILTVTLSLATADHGCPGNSVPEVLKYYDIPAGLFPDYVQKFSCKTVNSNNDDTTTTTTTLRLSIQLKGACDVTRAFGIKNVVACEPEISAIISRHRLSDVKGVTVTLSFQGQPVGQLMTISGVIISPDLLFGKTLQFLSREGVNSPKFPIIFFSDKPPTCDAPSAAIAYSDESASDFGTNKDGDVPIWVYNKYGRLLPFVAA